MKKNKNKTKHQKAAARFERKVDGLPSFQDSVCKKDKLCKICRHAGEARFRIQLYPGSPGYMKRPQRCSGGLYDRVRGPKRLPKGSIPVLQT